MPPFLRDMRALAVSAIVGCAFLSTSAAAQSPTESPTAVVTHFFDALHDSSWTAAAAMLDSSSAQTLRDNELSMLAARAMFSARDHGKRNAFSGGLTGFSSDGRVHPDVIARYGDTPINGFAPATTLAQVAALDLRTFLARALAFSARGFEGGSVEGHARVTRTVIGAVPEGDSLAHVLYRTSGPDVQYTDPRHVEIVRLVRHDSRWWVDLTVMNNDIVSGGLIFMANDEDVGRHRGQRSARPTP